MTESETKGTLAPGSIIAGRFKVDRVIGHGGMGEVYAAHHTTTSKEVALKVIRAGVGATADQTRRFMREARAATAIAHPNVIEVHDVFEDTDGIAVMVMELLKGETLAQCLTRRKALELHEVSKILVPAMRALEAAHEKGVVHRDLKPDNVFLAETSAGVVTKVLDFGIAKVLDPARLGSETQGQATSTGSLLGTPHYMSHEQAMSEKSIDARTDVWSMGVIVFEALTGRRPLQFETLGQMYKTFLQDDVPSIATVIPDLPADVAKALDECLVKHPGERATSLKRLADALALYEDANVPGARTGGKVIETLPSPAQPSLETKPPVSTSLHREAPRSSRTPWLIALGVVAIGAATAIGWNRASSTAHATQDSADVNIATTPPASTSAPITVDEPRVVVDASPISAPTQSVQHAINVRPPSMGSIGTSSPSASASTSAKHGIVDRDPYGSD